MNIKNLFNKYFQNLEIKPDFQKEYICIFDGWVGENNLHKLDEVTEKEWSKFNSLLRAMSKEYEMYLVNLEKKTCALIDNIESIIPTFNQSLKKGSLQFIKLIIPELNCIFTEEYDYTFIIWHKNYEALDRLFSLVTDAGLYHFNDGQTKVENK